jgi:hypothetical protein
MFYIGSHVGDENDGYIGSGIYFKNSYEKCPESFKRRILQRIVFTDYKELHLAEERWLNMIDDKELGHKYYNLKKYATGGNIVGCLSNDKQIQHKEKSIRARLSGWLKWYECQTHEYISMRGKYANSCIKNRSGGSMPGDMNPFYSKSHTEKTKIIMSEKAKERTNNIKHYKIVFPDGLSESFIGQRSIADKYNTDTCKIKFSAYIDTDTPIKSNRKNAAAHPLIGAKIYTT